MKSTVSYLLSSSSYHFHLIWPCALIVLESEEDEAFLSLIVSSYCYCAKMKNHPNGMPLACVGGEKEKKNKNKKERERRWRCWGGGGGDGGSSGKRVKSSFCSLFFLPRRLMTMNGKRTNTSNEKRKKEGCFAVFSLSLSFSLPFYSIVERVRRAHWSKSQNARHIDCEWRKRARERVRVRTLILTCPCLVCIEEERTKKKSQNNERIQSFHKGKDFSNPFSPIASLLALNHPTKSTTTATTTSPATNSMCQIATVSSSEEHELTRMSPNDYSIATHHSDSHPPHHPIDEGPLAADLQSNTRYCVDLYRAALHLRWESSTFYTDRLQSVRFVFQATDARRESYSSLLFGVSKRRFQCSFGVS